MIRWIQSSPSHGTVAKDWDSTALGSSWAARMASAIRASALHGWLAPQEQPVAGPLGTYRHAQETTNATAVRRVTAWRAQVVVAPAAERRALRPGREPRLALQVAA